MQQMEKIAVGNTADIYRDGNRVVKLFFSGCPADEAEKEAKKQTYALNKGVPVPKIYEITELDGRPAIIMEHIEGKTLAQICIEDMGKIAEYMEKSLEIHKSLHSIRAEGMIEYSNILVEKIYAVNDIDETKRNELIQLLYKLTNEKDFGDRGYYYHGKILSHEKRSDIADSFQHEISLCHGDLHLFNIMETDKGYTVIDWVDAVCGSYSCDLCRSYVLYLGFPEGIADLFLDMAAKIYHIEKNEILKWLPIHACARLLEVTEGEYKDTLMNCIFA